MTSSTSNSPIIDMSGCCCNSKQVKPSCQSTVLELGRAWQYVDIACGVVPFGVGFFGTAVAIYDYVQGDYLSAITETVLSGVLFLEGFRHVPNFLHKISMEGALKDLGKDNTRLDELNQEAKNNNLVLINKINSIEQLEISLRKQNIDLKESLMSETNHLAETGSKLEATTKRLEVVGKLYQKFKENLESLRFQNKDFKDSNNLIKENISDLKKEDLKINSFEQIINGDIKSIEDINSIFEKQILDDRKLLDEFTEQKKKSEERLRIAEEQIDVLKKQISDLDISDDKFKDGSKENNETAKEIGNSVDRMKEIIDQLKQKKDN